MVAAIVAFCTGVLFCLLLTRPAIVVLKRLGWSQFVRADGPQTHLVKKGTPTKGGLVFGAGTVVAYSIAHAVTGQEVTTSGVLVLLAMAGMGAVGFVDDYLKTHHQNSTGLPERAKIVGQLLVIALLVPVALWGADRAGRSLVSSHITFVGDVGLLDLARWGPVVAVVLALVWYGFLSIGTTNGVNIVDGADGLLAGCAISSLSAYALMLLFQAQNTCSGAGGPGCFDTVHPQDLAVVTCALLGNLVGFLWWSCYPAKIFMGDTGSLGIGGFLVALAVLSRTELLLPIIGVIYVMVTSSVLIQRYYFRFTGGKRFFKMAPLHHHFELSGWSETTVTIRFWLISALGAITAVIIFYSVWLARTGLVGP
ncbi:phospho-N-acetylmuramoyl-pentapeptide-transferase [Desertihabitans aurantiacus]|uniref:phospho-N-acetylmuramoyl-pentapeptide- transferase n=1 Tax=Desertihabitans aurantiacus TaxID=2282477 RepID=UPI000DF745A9|nr:phospho-N-acetylmuramoyl-pentapeptide-transferase [Desertihabitans aurantiacus]